MAKARLQAPAKAAKRRRRKPRKPGPKKRSRGKPFITGPDPRRNMKGPSPAAHELREALLRDGPSYIDALFRSAMQLDTASIKVAVEQMLGRPPQAIEVTGKGGAPIEVVDARERLLQRVEKLLARGAAQPVADGASGAAAKPDAGGS